MKDKSVNEKLFNLYESNWDNLIEGMKDLKTNAAHPLLIKVDEGYEKSDVKVMIIGQETDGWAGCFNEKFHSIEFLMNLYRAYYYKGRFKDQKRAFWNKKNFKFFEVKLKKYFVEKEQKSVAFIWNNISKIGKHGRGKPGENIMGLERRSFNILKNEIEILKPDMIIFTTGRREKYITHHFGKVDFLAKLGTNDLDADGRTKSLISEVKFSDPNLRDICSIMIEHPNRRTLDNELIFDILIDCWKKSHCMGVK